MLYDIYDHVSEAMRHLSPYDDCEGTDIYEFGVLLGNTLNEYVPQIQKIRPVRKVFGFDSFIGLPPEKEGVPVYDQDWWEGNFNSTADGSSVEDVMDRIRQRINFVNLTLIPGFYCDSLRPELVSDFEMGPAYYVNVDCDLYVSTIDCLEFLFSNRLVVPGTVIRYDDWRQYGPYGRVEWEAGESLAHKEMTEKYGVDCTRLSMNVFRVNYQN